jgi:hypothetical protein
MKGTMRLRNMESRKAFAKHFCNQAVREAERLFAFHSVNGSPCARCVDMSGPRR